MAKFSPIKYIKESRDELRKVTWPSRQTTIRYTLIVVVSCIVIGLVIGGLDFALQEGIKQLLF